MHRIDGAGHADHMFVSEDPTTSRPPTEFTPEWFNAVQEELATFIEWAGIALVKSDNTQLKTALLEKFATITALNGRVPWFATGCALPSQNIGPIWHDDYNSLMTWQAFTANGAAYTGYASVLVGGLLIDTQPTPRAGYVRSGVTNLSRTAYAALRAWAMHNGIMVASGTWAAGTIAVKDNADGTTFTAFDVRGEFPRFWDDGRGIDAGRASCSHQNDEYRSHNHVIKKDVGSSAAAAGTGSNAANGGDGFWYSQATEFSGGSETRPRNTAFLAEIKF